VERIANLFEKWSAQGEGLNDEVRNLHIFFLQFTYCWITKNLKKISMLTRNLNLISCRADNCNTVCRSLGVDLNLKKTIDYRVKSELNFLYISLDLPMTLI